MGVTKEQMAAAVEEYCRAESEKDKQAWLALFSEEVVHEDPVGSGNVNCGLSAVATFWDNFVGSDVELWCEEPVIVCANEAVALMRCRVGPSDNRWESGRIVDHFVFNEDGKITNVRAFWSL